MISTGLRNLDSILKGGIRDGMITDIFGAAGTGKTQLTLQISINFLLKEGKVHFHDTTGGFRPERMLQIIKLKNMDPKILDNVKVTRITNVAEQKKHLLKLIDNPDYSLLVVDNVSDLFSYEYSKESQILNKNLELMKYMQKLSSFAVKNQIPVVITNVVRHKENLEYENLEKAISFFTHVKIHLFKEDSNYFGEVNTIFNKSNFSYLITPEGLLDKS